MTDAKQLISQVFTNHQIKIPPARKEAFEAFLRREENQEIINQIISHQNTLMARWKLEDRIAAITEQPVRILNATVGKPYETLLSFEKLDWKDISDYEFGGLEELGLHFDPATQLVMGTPTASGDHKITFRFRLEEEEKGAAFHEKSIPFIVNPDPKSLWKSLESNREDPYWKEDNVTVLAPLADRHILVSSKRGRSHANIGSFREDDFSFADLANGWSIVVVADGAGSSKLSRKGSAMACKGIVDYFTAEDAAQGMLEFDSILQQYQSGADPETLKSLNRFVYNNLGKAAFSIHKSLADFAKENSLALKDLSSTLIFTLLKKYDAGYAFLSFGVGDCPTAILNKDLSEVHLMNWLDVGEFSGGTRFITMPEIFQNEKFATRFGFKLVEDYAYLVMMSDGIYDPKFSVESNLADIKKWQAFFADLGGQNEDGIKVDLRADNTELEQQFSQWMDFWSPGNHDDRTLAIVF
jgi:hypothetical protein